MIVLAQGRSCVAVKDYALPPGTHTTRLPLCRLRDYVQALLPVLLPAVQADDVGTFLSKAATASTLESFVDGSVTAVFFAASQSGA